MLQFESVLADALFSRYLAILAIFFSPFVYTPYMCILHYISSVFVVAGLFAYKYV